jgi:hypothetical protein
MLQYFHFLPRASSCNFAPVFLRPTARLPASSVSFPFSSLLCVRLQQHGSLHLRSRACGGATSGHRRCLALVAHPPARVRHFAGGRRRVRVEHAAGPPVSSWRRRAVPHGPPACRSARHGGASRQPRHEHGPPDPEAPERRGGVSQGVYREAFIWHQRKRQRRHRCVVRVLPSLLRLRRVNLRGGTGMVAAGKRWTDPICSGGGDMLLCMKSTSRLPLRSDITLNVRRPPRTSASSRAGTTVCWRSARC